jgi:hypothetical protein
MRKKLSNFFGTIIIGIVAILYVVILTIIGTFGLTYLIIKSKIKIRNKNERKRY